MELKISIVTPSYNNARFINDTIESVLYQDYKNYEHIVVDNCSTDGTIEILKKYPHLKWISEIDKGPSSAIKKGFKIANGDIFVWLNSDDYFELNILKKISDYFKSDDNLNILIGNITFVDINKKILVKDRTFNFDKAFLLNHCADVVRQPATFFRKEIYKNVGELDESLKIVFDYELFIKMLIVTEPKFVDENFAYVRDFKDTISRRMVRKQAIEIFKVSRKYGGNIFSQINKTNLKKILLNRN
jgi:glycosyltransferase involved in cell wall biosynthesis